MTKRIIADFDRPDDFNITSSKAIFQDGTTIAHKDYYYKNEISVVSSGKTYTYDTPNVSAVFFIILNIILIILLIKRIIFCATDPKIIKQINNKEQI